jgi:hypothetical protein
MWNANPIIVKLVYSSVSGIAALVAYKTNTDDKRTTNFLRKQSRQLSRPRQAKKEQGQTESLYHTPHGRLSP